MKRLGYDTSVSATHCRRPCVTHRQTRTCLSKTKTKTLRFTTRTETKKTCENGSRVSRTPSLPIANTDSLLYTLEDHAVQQGLWNTTIALYVAV